jgi:hypothetical protein
LHHHLKEKLKAKEDNDLIFTISTVDTPENPEDALVALEESCQMDNNDNNTLWSRVTTSEIECGWVEFIRCTHNAIEMAHENAKSHAKEEITLPEEFKRHAALFLDKEAKKFPPSRPHNHKIELTDKAPATFNMKMYLMSNKDQITEDKFLDENLEKGYIVPSDSPYRFPVWILHLPSPQER